MNIFACLYIYIYVDTDLVQITYAMQNFLTKIVIGVQYLIFITYFMYLVSGTEEILSHILGALWVTKRISW